jgi:hypothetical protein
MGIFSFSASDEKNDPGFSGSFSAPAFLEAGL